MSKKRSFKAFKYSNLTKKLEIYSSVETFFFFFIPRLNSYINSQDHNLKLEIGSKF